MGSGTTENGKGRARSPQGMGRVSTDREVMLPGGLVIPAGLDPVMADVIGVVNRPDHAAWMRQVERIGGCAHPVHLKGFTRLRERASGQVVSEFSTRDMPGGVLLVRCGNRRASRCPSCAYLYQGDVYQLVRAGMDGGKGIPDTVSGHPRVFATLTAPSFGAVHCHRPSGNRTGNGDIGPCHPRRTLVCEHDQTTVCFARHGDDDPVVGTPLCADCYDYTGAVIWQASVGMLWERFCIYLRRHLAKVSGRSAAQVTADVRLSYVKIVEYQRRGLVHIHAVIRADGMPCDPDSEDEGSALAVIAPPAWVTAGLLAGAVVSAARAVRVRVDGGNVGYWSFGWGAELDVHDITAFPGEDGAGKVAAYVAKYATKDTEVTGWESWRRPTNQRGVHAEMMVAAAFGLCEVPELAGLKLGRWGRELAYRGHVSSKSRRYSTTLGKLRQARADHQKEQARSAPLGSSGSPEIGRLAEGIGPAGVDRESFWELAGFGYTVGEALLAAREAGAARSRAGGRDRLGRADDVRERGARGESE